MCDLTPVIEGPVKFRDGKKWKVRYACVTRLSPVADSLTLQLWKDRSDAERNPPTKGSIALEGYLGWEAGFTLDRESLTLAVVLRDAMVTLAFDARETMMRWQVRLTSQFEEGQHFSAHLLQSPAKSKFPTGSVGVRVHLQNKRFSLTTGVPPKLLHSWDLSDLRRYGVLEQVRFCFEGGSRCGRGEGLHVLRMDDPESMKAAFDQAAKGRLENKRKSLYKTVSNSPSIPSCLDRQMSQSSDLGSTAGFSCTGISVVDFGAENDAAAAALVGCVNRNRSTSRTRSMNWSSNEGSSCDTMSMALSEMPDGGFVACRSPEHLVNRKALLERIGIEDRMSSRPTAAVAQSSACSEFGYPQWTMKEPLQQLQQLQIVPAMRKPVQKTHSIDRLSMSSQGSAGSGSNYDSPKSVLTSSTAISSGGSLTPQMYRRQQIMSRSGAENPPPPPQKNRATQNLPHLASNGQRQRSTAAAAAMTLDAAPCGCSAPGDRSAYDNYDIPRSLGGGGAQQQLVGQIQDPLQFYDTPRSIKESIQGDHQHPPAFGNYDFPQNGSLPVYRKQCGCVIKLVAAQNSYSWQCVSDGEPASTAAVAASSLRISAPRARLTGTGKMPVVDMSLSDGPNSLPAAKPQPMAQGLPPKSPVYAAVNKGKKFQRPHHNYCNIEPNKADSAKGGDFAANNGNGELLQGGSGHIYENTKSVLDRLHLEQQRRAVDLLPNYQNLDFTKSRNRQAQEERSKEGNYLMMTAVGGEGMLTKGQRTSYSYTNLTELPLIPFQPTDGLPPDPNIYCDSINRKLRQFHDSLNPAAESDRDEDDLPPPPEPGQLLDFTTELEVKMPLPPAAATAEKSHSTENLETVGAATVVAAASTSMTMPRSSSTTTSAADTTLTLGVSMRRSSSVPCKRLDSRGSTGSSDSGFSAGSPGGGNGNHKSRANGEREEEEATSV